jgi:hypothetical protein
MSGRGEFSREFPLQSNAATTLAQGRSRPGLAAEEQPGQPQHPIIANFAESLQSELRNSKPGDSAACLFFLDA